MPAAPSNEKGEEMSLLMQRDAVEKIAADSTDGTLKVLAAALSKALFQLVEHTNVINTQGRMIEALELRIKMLESGPHGLA